MGLTAGSALWDSGNFSYPSAAELITQLQNRFGSGNQKERYRMELKSRRRGPSETLQSLYQDIKKLLALSYGTAAEDVIEVIGIDSFTDALNDNNLRIAVLQKGCATLDEAFTIAVRLEAIISTTPSDQKIVHGTNGQRTDRASARMISTATTTASMASLTPEQVELQYWKSLTLARKANQTTLSDLARPSPSYSTSGYGESINETSRSSGSHRSVDFHPQEPSQQQGPHYEGQYAG